MTNRNRWRVGRNWGVGIALGVGVGVAFGVALDNMWIGIALGAALLPAFAMVQGAEEASGGAEGDDER